MATIDAEVRLDAEPEAVWATLADPNRFEEWLTIHVKWKGDTPSEFVPGAQVSQVVTMLGMPNTIAWTVEEVEAPVRLVISGEGMAAVKARFELGVTAHADGGSVASIQSQFDGALVKGALEKAIVKESKNQLDASMAKLGELLAGANA